MRLSKLPLVIAATFSGALCLGSEPSYAQMPFVVSHGGIALPSAEVDGIPSCLLLSVESPRTELHRKGQVSLGCMVLSDSAPGRFEPDSHWLPGHTVVGSIGWDRLTDKVVGIDFKSGVLHIWDGSIATRRSKEWIGTGKTTTVGFSTVSGPPMVPGKLEGDQAVFALATAAQFSSLSDSSLLSGLPQLSLETFGSVGDGAFLQPGSVHLLGGLEVAGFQVPFTPVVSTKQPLTGSDALVRIDDLGSDRVVIDGPKRTLTYEVPDEKAALFRSAHRISRVPIGLGQKGRLEIGLALYGGSNRNPAWDALRGWEVLAIGDLSAEELLHGLVADDPLPVVLRLVTESRPGKRVRLRGPTGAIKEGTLSDDV